MDFKGGENHPEFKLTETLRLEAKQVKDQGNNSPPVTYYYQDDMNQFTAADTVYPSDKKWFRKSSHIL